MASDHEDFQDFTHALRETRETQLKVRAAIDTTHDTFNEQEVWSVFSTSEIVPLNDLRQESATLT